MHLLEFKRKPVLFALAFLLLTGICTNGCGRALTEPESSPEETAPSSAPETASPESSETASLEPSSPEPDTSVDASEASTAGTSGNMPFTPADTPAMDPYTGTVTENGILYSANTGPLVCIDAGHQAHGNAETEPDGPGSTVYKAKVATGTSGRTTGLAESMLNLQVSCKLRDALLARGYRVLMIRETQEVDLSNATRAQMANAAGVEAFIRIHANGSDDPNVSGALTMCPTAANPYPIGTLYNACRSLSACIIDNLCLATGAVNRGIMETDTMSGINWCETPVTIVEMGFMTNPQEDTLMATEDYQNRIVAGIADGIDLYFGR